MIDAGLPPKVAEAQLEIFSEIADSSLATKQDIHSVKQEIVDVRQEIANVKFDIIKWVMGIMIALFSIQTAILATVIKIFH